MTHFVPSREWADAFYAADCPLARVSVSFSDASVSSVNEAVRSYTAGLQEGCERTDSYDQVFFSGGWSLGLHWQYGGYPVLVLSSAGEDGLDSLESAAQELTDALAESCPGVVLTYTEMPFKNQRCVKRTKA